MCEVGLAKRNGDILINGAKIDLIKFNTEEAERHYNYPYNALEEAVVNAVFHKSYREAEPVEIRVYVDCIQIINYPGPANRNTNDLKRIKK